MLIKTHFIPKGRDAIAVCPFIFIRPEKASDRGLIEHEKVHYKEQLCTLVLPWFLCYWLSKKFRLAAELRAYKRQVELKDITVGKAAHLLTKSKIGISFLDALKKLRKK